MSIIKKKNFDTYRINEFLKAGGMASIYEAYDIKNRQKVALKIMHENLSRQSDLANKFLREGDILEKLQNDEINNPDYPIVKVRRHSRENNDPNGTAFISLELLIGIDLQDFLIKLKFQNLCLTSIEICEIILQVAKGLSVCHKRKIWHRDLSPDNIFLLKEAAENHQFKIKLIDFGVAKFEYMSHDSLGGALFGKPPYISPEQCKSLPVDGRSDIYSLGMNFFTLLNGSPAFTGDNPIEVLKMHVERELPPLPSSVPSGISNIIHKMCQKNPEYRYQTIEELILELEKIIAELPAERSDAGVFELIAFSTGDKREKITVRKSFTFNLKKTLENTVKKAEEKKEILEEKEEKIEKIKKGKSLKFIIPAVIFVLAFAIYFSLPGSSVSEGSFSVLRGMPSQKVELGKTDKNFIVDIDFTPGFTLSPQNSLSLYFQKKMSDFYQIRISYGEVFLLKNYFGEKELVSSVRPGIEGFKKLTVHVINERIFIYADGAGLFNKAINNELSSLNSGISLAVTAGSDEYLKWRIVHQ